MELTNIFTEKFEHTNIVNKKCNVLLVGDSNTHKTRFYNSFVQEEQICVNGVPTGQIAKLGSIDSNFPFGTSTEIKAYEISDPETEAFEKWVKKAQWILIFFNFENRQSFRNLPCWFNRVRKLRPAFIHISIVGMNADSNSADKVTGEEMKELERHLAPSFSIYSVNEEAMFMGSDSVFNEILLEADLLDVNTPTEKVN